MKSLWNSALFMQTLIYLRFIREIMKDSHWIRLARTFLGAFVFIALSACQTIPKFEMVYKGHIYMPTRLLGSGNHGNVYLLESDTSNDRFIAKSLFDKNSRANMEEEVHYHQKLEVIGIPTVHAFLFGDYIIKA